MVCRLDSVGLIHKKMIILRLWQSFKRTETPEYFKKNENDNAVLIEVLKIKVCFVVCDNVFLQIFYNCSNVEETFSWHN